MLFVKLEDHTNNVEILVFPSLLKANPEVWQDGKVIICQGRVSDKDQETKFLAGKALELNLQNIQASVLEFEKIQTKSRNNNWQYAKKETAVKSSVQVKQPDNSLKIVINPTCDEKLIDVLRKSLVANIGNDKVYFKIFNNGQPNIIETGFRVTNTPELASVIKSACGDAVTVITTSN